MNVSIIVFLFIIVFSVTGCKKRENKVVSGFGEVKNNNDLKSIIFRVYNNIDKSVLPSTEFIEIDFNNKEQVKSYIGIDDTEKFEFAVASKSISDDEPYLFVIAVVKNGVNAEETAKIMNDNVDSGRWKGLEAEDVFSANSGNIICLVIAKDKIAKSVMESIKNITNDFTKVYKRTVYL